MKNYMKNIKDNKIKIVTLKIKNNGLSITRIY